MNKYYDHAGITIYHGECEQVLPECDFDVIVTDPPYGLDKGGKGCENDPGSDEVVRLMEWLVSLGKPLVYTMRQTLLTRLPQAQWIAVWHKPYNPSLCWVPFYPHWEPMLCYHLPRRKATHSDVFSANTEKNRLHKTQKPLRLYRELLQEMPEGTIIDPFMGSGTTLRAAKDLGRKAIGIELEEKYCEVAANRMGQETLW